MRAVVITTGTQGDVAPYTGIGARLQAEGWKVTFATHKVFGDQLESCGFDFSPIPGDPAALVSSQAFQSWERSGYSRRSARDQVGRIKAIIGDVGELMYEVAGGLIDAVPNDTDVLLLSGTAAPLAYHFAEARRIPSMGIYWGPTEPTGQFPPPMGGARSYGWWGNKAAGHIGLRITNKAYVKAVDRLRAQLGVPAAGYADTRRRQARREWPVMHGFSPTVFPRPRDWRRGMEVVGYWWAQRGKRWTPPAALTDFLAAGPPPVFIGFGSMSPGEVERLADLATAALRKARLRGVIQAGWAQLDARNDDVLTIGAAPHDWLFPQMAAIVHHAGAGTTGAALRAGVPAVPVPVTIDQPFWASRIVALGVAPKAIPFCALTADGLADALRLAVTDPVHTAAARAVAAAVEREDGAGRVAKAVARLAERGF
ncbi:glycosyltransferase [Amycolatopsis sp. TNS106]|uniref:glycosyltransferase n=1 Tax=Amycolatopsis sp. TNS106 TaxID=2861750 RepID=UPI001C58A19D|nr:glycosyltransferase [Amycolatopsis sp. TNS106]QXV56967.1 UDP-glucose--sterol glucosyltransferase [Amycolatopsis sp. TNS106]